MRRDEMGIKNGNERKYDWKERWIDGRRCPEGEMYLCMMSKLYIKIKRKHPSRIYGVDKLKSNPNCCTNPVGMLVLGWVMLDLL